MAPVFLAREFRGEPEIREREKHSGLGWFPLNDLPRPLTISAETAAQYL